MPSIWRKSRLLTRPSPSKMAGESQMELLFLDTFKHQNSEQGSNVDVVRFPCVVYINEVRVIPPGVRAHNSLPDSRAYGETSPHTFHLDLFFNNVSKPSATVFDRLGSLDYDENTSIIFRPNAKINTDGLVLKGWYNCLTVAVYGSVDRVIISHDRDSPPPPPPPPPPPQHQQIGLKRNPKHGGEKEEDGLHREGYFEPISPDRVSVHPDGNYSDEDDGEDDPQDEGDEDDEEEDDDDDLNAEDEEDEEDDQTGESIADEEDEDDEGDDEDLEDDVYEQISSDEDGIADFEREAFKYPSFDIDYTPEDLASVPTVAYDPYDRDLGPLLYFSCPYRTAFENEISRLQELDLDKENSGAIETSVKLTELLELYQDDRSSKWVTALEEVSGLIVKGLSFMMLKEPGRDHLSQLVDWAMQALDLQLALQQPIALNVRQLKAGTKLVSSLAECGSQAVEALLNANVIGKLYNLLFADHVSSSLKLNAFRSLDSVLSTNEGMEAFLKYPSEGQGKSGYQKLLDLILLDQTVRVFTSCSAVLQKCHFYEILSDVKKTGDQLVESAAAPQTQNELGQEAKTALERPTREYDNDVEMPMEMEHLLEAANVSEGDLEKLVGLLNEILHLLEKAPHTMIQSPVKSFPTSARITGPPERDDPYPVLFRYLHHHQFLESATLLLSLPGTSSHPGVMYAIREILRFLTQSQKGILFLLFENEATNLVARALCQASEQEQEENLPSDGNSEDSFALWLLHATQALQYISELFHHFQNCTDTEETDHANLLGILHNLYLITFNPVGRSAVAHVFSLDKNLQCLITLMEFCSKEALGDTKSKKSVAYNYACLLVLLVVQTSNDVQILEGHSAPLLKLCKADENNAKLQELAKWLEPIKSIRFEINCISSLIDYIKQNIDNLMTQEGVGLLTALRILCHVACPPAPVEGQQKDLKWNLAVIQLFSAEGMDTFIRILQKLNGILIQPWRLHVNLGTILYRAITISVARCTLSLLKTMLMELLRGGSFEFKDMRVPCTLVTLHMLLCSIPLSGRLDGEEQKIQNDIIDILLTFTQGVNEQLTISEETLANNTWSLMLKEVLSSILKVPEGFFSGLIILSELLPLPLPMQTTQAIESQDIAVALNTRKLWSMHLHVHSKLLQDIVRSISGTSCQPLQYMIRRVCIQLCDLASPTAILIMRTVLDLIVEDLQSSPEDKEKQYTGQLARLLALLDSLAAHRACKVAILHLISGGKGDERYAELFQELLTMMKSAADSVIHQQCGDYVMSIIQYLCDQDIALILPSSTEAQVSEQEQLANALPSKELLPSICDSLMETFANNDSSYASILTAIRTMMFLSEHDYGFYHLKSSLKKQNSALYVVLKRIVCSFGKDTGELASSFLDFMRQIMNSESMGSGEEGGMMEVDGSHPSKTQGLTTSEIKHLLLSKEETSDNLLLDLEKLVLEQSKEDDRLETLLDNVSSFRQILESAKTPVPLSDQDVEPILPATDSLQNMFNSRTVYILADMVDEQLKSLSVTPFQPEEADADLDMVKVDLLELSAKCCSDFDLKFELERSFLLEPSSPGRTKTTKGFKLGKHKHETFITSGKSEYIEPAKRAHFVPLPRGRGRGGFLQNMRPHDLFRQRKQNTSRPPSMHVDDFVAAERKEVPPPVGIPPPKRPPKVSPKVSSRGGFPGNRGGGRGVFHNQSRFFTPPAPKVNYNRREGVRVLNWSPQAAPRGAYVESRGAQSNFDRAPLPPLRQSSAGYRPNPRERVARGRGGIGPSWTNAASSANSSRGKFLGGNGNRGRHVRSFTR
ncbi:protein virilizer homolog isoform X2 [Xenopus laevis]|uniref:Protein virilizer homolog isoform X2 n=1 Tax=Xenopus laevis TaxID=8355 RepID=A0A8J0VKG8_XENLA|nr:protein virilizer homolog isoform X2 [Xenopus laevis]